LTLYLLRSSGTEPPPQRDDAAACAFSHWRSVKPVQSWRDFISRLRRIDLQMMRGNITIVNEMEF
jgi:hypothetical protein